jgi:small subunit ribosomal protein S16
LAVKIRLARTGRKNVSRFRIVAIDGPTRRDGKFLEVLGNYNPQVNPKQFSIETERVQFWISQGAQVSETVANLLKQDRFSEKVEGLKKGLALDTLNIERHPERKRKAKNAGKKKKGEEAAKPA